MAAVVRDYNLVVVHTLVGLEQNMEAVAVVAVVELAMH